MLKQETHFETFANQALRRSAVSETYIVFLAALQHVVVDGHVIAKKFHLLSHVAEQTTNQRSKVNYMSGLVLGENGVSVGSTPTGASTTITTKCEYRRSPSFELKKLIF